MSVSFSMGASNLLDFVEIGCQFVTIKNLKTLIAGRLGVHEEEISVINLSTNVEYASNVYIRKGSGVRIDRSSRDLSSQPLLYHQIVSNDQFEAMMQDCRFYMIKSSNQENIQKARDKSVWATTYSNQEKLKSAFNCYKHVLLMFGTNRSYEIKGIARMESEPDKVIDKTIWSGVNNIRLGGNFRIRWIRKKPLGLSQIEKALGVGVKEEILRLCDGHEMEMEVSRKIALLFELPTEPYYQPEKVVPLPARKEKEKEKEEIVNIRDILGDRPPSISNFYITPAQLIMRSHINTIHLQKAEEKESHSSEPKKRKDIKKKKKKKKKRKHKHKSSSSESSPSESSPSERSPSESSSSERSPSERSPSESRSGRKSRKRRR